MATTQPNGESVSDDEPDCACDFDHDLACFEHYQGGSEFDE